MDKFIFLLHSCKPKCPKTTIILVKNSLFLKSRRKFRGFWNTWLRPKTYKLYIVLIWGLDPFSYIYAFWPYYLTLNTNFQIKVLWTPSCRSFFTYQMIKCSTLNYALCWKFWPFLILCDTLDHNNSVHHLWFHTAG